MMHQDKKGAVAAVLVGCLLGLHVGVAWAQPTEPDAAKPAAQTPDKPAAGKPGAPAMPPGSSVKVERTASGAKLFRITEGMLVEGQMQRPNAFLVLQRATVEYDYEALSESFLPRIVAATREKPF